MRSAAAVTAAMVALAALGCSGGSPPPKQSGGPSPAPAATAAEKREAARDGAAFACDLYATLAAGRKDDNLFFSPLGVSTALGMTYAGACGQTAVQMRKGLRLALPDDRFHPAAGALLADLDAAGRDAGFELSVANSLWCQKGKRFLPEFLALCRTGYGASLETADLAGDPDGARTAINAWAAKGTRNRLPEVVPPGMLNPLSRLVLVNAVHFRGGWEKVFDPERTRDAVFRLARGRTVTVPMMRQTDRFDYGLGQGFSALELPYKGKRLAMLILLPNQDDGLDRLDRLEAQLCAELFGGVQLENQEVRVSLPRFVLSCDHRLDEALKALGMAAAFDKDKADFSGINGVSQPDPEALHIAAVLQKTFVEVNEKGTEATAAAAVHFEAKNGHTPPIFAADHPFVFAIRDRQTGALLLLGRVANPAPEKEPDKTKR